MYCEWYEKTCPQKKCNGEGYVHCKMRCKGIFYDKVRREYHRVVTKGSPVNTVPCLSFLEKTLETVNL